MDDINEALIAAVKALGGSKQVGPLLWPEKTPDAAQRTLLDCLNPDRPAHLTPEQIVLIGRKARDRGCHVLMQFLASTWSYADPQPIEPKDELADLLRQYLQQRDSDKGRDERIQRLIAQHLQVKAVAA